VKNKIYSKILKNIKFSLLIGFLIMFFITISKYIKKNNYFQINDVIILNNSFINEQDINVIIKEFTEENSIFDVSFKNIKNELKNHNFINSCKIHTNLPSTIMISIQEINPLALFEKNNEIYFLDFNSNYILADISSMNFFDVPIISIINNKNDINHKKTAKILRKIINNNSELYHSLMEIKYDENYMNFILDNDTKIKINKSNALKETNILLTFIETVKNISKYKYIDLTINNQIIVKENKINI